jgi:hypothetical protein
VLYPDSNSTYWTTPYQVKPGMRIYLKGRYPTARYFSIQAYNNDAQPYSVGGATSSLTDYQITPSIGRNPWSAAAGLTASMGHYEITLRSLSRCASTSVSAMLRNTLPIAPASPTTGDLPADIGFLMIRVYLPPQLNFSAVPLPTIKARGQAAVTLPWLRLTVGNQQARIVGFGEANPQDRQGQIVYHAGAVSTRDRRLPAESSVLRAPRGQRHPVPEHDQRWQVRYWSLCNYV